MATTAKTTTKKAGVKTTPKTTINGHTSRDDGFFNAIDC